MQAVDDGDVLSLMMGLVCARCDSYNDPGALSCTSCGILLGTPTPLPTPHVLIEASDAPSPAACSPAAPAPVPLTSVERIPEVTEAVLPSPSSAPAAALQCWSCRQPTDVDDRFCRLCGAKVQVLAANAPVTRAATLPAMAALPHVEAPTTQDAPPQAGSPTATLFMPRAGAVPTAAPTATMFFGAASIARYARLLLIRGSTNFGTQWRLQASKTVIGRNQGAVIFPDDEYLADKHCQLEFRGDELWLAPEQSGNGVFLQLRSRTSITDGAEFVCGSQRFGMVGLDMREQLHRREEDETEFCGSPQVAAQLHLRRISTLPQHEERYLRSQRLLTIGRSGCDLNYPSDGYLSTRHAQVGRADDGNLFLEDLGSRNGTFVRVYSPYRLQHGDTLLLGAQVMRIELSAGSAP
ncbi:MAG: FHA domain-containing protein [Myxococcota bacterium]